jgi:hypothetical protein
VKKVSVAFPCHLTIHVILYLQGGRFEVRSMAPKDGSAEADNRNPLRERKR